MLRKLLPILMALIGLGVGVGGGLALKPAAEAQLADQTAPGTGAPNSGQAPGDAAGDTGAAQPAGNGHAATQTIPETAEGDATLRDYVKMNNQFVVPVVVSGQVASMVILALSLEVAVGGTERVYLMEPKLRDVFLQVMFDHANSGGFSGDFTQGTNMVILRDALRESARKTLGSMVTDVLIIDIARQDL